MTNLITQNTIYSLWAIVCHPFERCFLVIAQLSTILKAGNCGSKVKEISSNGWQCWLPLFTSMTFLADSSTADTWIKHCLPSCWLVIFHVNQYLPASCGTALSCMQCSSLSSWAWLLASKRWMKNCNKKLSGVWEREPTRNWAAEQIVQIGSI